VAIVRDLTKTGDEAETKVSLPGGGGISSLAFHTNDILAVGTGTGQLYVWDLPAKKRLYDWKLPGPIQAAALSTDGRYLMSCNANGTVYILRLAQPVTSTGQ
jgi:WD40 repeat protein